jgi:hypothetical protein
MIKIVSEKRTNKNEIYSRFELIINSKFIRKIIKFISKKSKNKSVIKTLLYLLFTCLFNGF